MNLRKNTLKAVCAFFLASLTMIPAYAADPVFEIGVGAFSQYTISSEAVKNGNFGLNDFLDIERTRHSGGPSNWGGEISISLNTLIGDLALKVNPIYEPGNNGGTNPLYEGTLRGNVLGFIQLQELMVRRNALNLSGDSNLAMLGLGPSLNLPFDLGKIAVSLGVAYAQYQYEVTEEKEAGGENNSRYWLSRTQNEDMIGAYIGTHMKLKFWRIENELYAAYYMDSGTVSEIVSGGDGSTRQTQQPSLVSINGGFQGFNVDNTTFIQAFKLPIGVLGPELRIRFLQMPQSEEFTARLGLKFKAAF